MTNSKLMVAAAVAALMAGSGIAMAQSPNQGQEQKSPSAQSSPSSGTGQSSDRMKSGDQMKSGTSGAGSASERSNARQPQGDMRSTQGPGKDSNARGEQGSERRSQSGQEQKLKKGESGQKGSTTGQAPTGEKGDRLQKSEQQKKMQKSEQKSEQKMQQDRSGTMQRGQTSGQGGMQREGQGGTMQRGTTDRGGVSGSTTTERGGASASVNLTSEQRTKIHQVIVKERNAPRVTNVDFQLNVGTVVPRERVRLVRVPQEIIEIQPAWRGYMYFLVGDEIVIVEPSTYRIVAIIEA
jgi:hypothetical protein